MACASFTVGIIKPLSLLVAPYFSMNDSVIEIVEPPIICFIPRGNLFEKVDYSDDNIDDHVFGRCMTTKLNNRYETALMSESEANEDNFAEVEGLDGIVASQLLNHDIEIDQLVQIQKSFWQLAREISIIKLPISF
jgi:hypothetical protein